MVRAVRTIHSEPALASVAVGLKQSQWAILPHPLWARVLSGWLPMRSRWGARGVESAALPALIVVSLAVQGLALVDRFDRFGGANVARGRAIVAWICNLDALRNRRQNVIIPF